MKTAIYVLSALALILGGVAVALWLSPAFGGNNGRKICYGLYEGRMLVEMTDGHGNSRFAVEDGDGHTLFYVPVRNCLLDVRFRGGRLRFREKATGRGGYVDKDGIVTFMYDDKRSDGYEQAVHESADFAVDSKAAGGGERIDGGEAGRVGEQPRALDDEDLRKLKKNNPFYNEAVKVLSGKLSVGDAGRRRVILNYCEHFRTAYVTKDIDFLRQVFSDDALIIVGNVVKVVSKGGGYVADKRVEYYLRTKDGYLSRLQAAFAANKKIDVGFSDFRIMRHPTIDGIYGVSLRQRYASDRYSDDGWLFLLWDFRDDAMPRIYVRTWQPAADVKGSGDVISISDFNME